MLAAYVASAAIVFSSAALSSYFTSKRSKSEWYLCIKPRSLTPPSYLFGIVWTLLYICLFFALGAVFVKRDWILCLMIISALVLNIVWCYLYFTKKLVREGVYCILAISAVALTSVAYAAITGSKGIAVLLAPYAAWVSFATILNMLSVPKIDTCKDILF